MKLSWRIELVQLTVIAAMFAVAAWSWQQVPGRLPVHWNLQGQPDRWGGKFEGLLLMPLIALGLYGLMLVVPLVDPGRRNYANFAKAFNVIRIALVLFLALIYSVSVLAAFGRQLNMTTVILPAVGILFIVIGNVLGKIRPNWFVGVRTPWTLSSKLSWDKTHRLAGWLFVFMGALFFVLALVQTGWMFAIMLAIDGLCLAWIVAYSYVVYRRDPQRMQPAATSPGTEDRDILSPGETAVDPH
jgi:uncharacterized membrane protein